MARPKAVVIYWPKAVVIYWPKAVVIYLPPVFLGDFRHAPSNGA